MRFLASVLLTSIALTGCSQKGAEYAAVPQAATPDYHVAEAQAPDEGPLKSLRVVGSDVSVHFSLPSTWTNVPGIVLPNSSVGAYEDTTSHAAIFIRTKLADKPLDEEMRVLLFAMTASEGVRAKGDVQSASGTVTVSLRKGYRNGRLTIRSLQSVGYDHVTGGTIWPEEKATPVTNVILISVASWPAECTDCEAVTEQINSSVTLGN